MTKRNSFAEVSSTQHLRAGPLTVLYDAGDLRYIRLGEKEILRRLYVAVRDQNWGTVAGVIRNERIVQTDDSFEIAYESFHQQNEIAFSWQAFIRGNSSGAIHFEMKGKALSDFLRNRIGFCVLHPVRECIDTAATITHVDGSSSTRIFSEDIAPQLVRDGVIQPVHPFSEMRTLGYAVTPEVQAEITFSGDIFEMEDQRNWIDASYKTYCTPLRLPWPVEIKKGQKIEQSVCLKLHGTSPRVEADIPEMVTISISDDKTILPGIGLGVASHGEPLSESELERLKKLNFSHLRLDLELSSHYQARLERAVAEARALGVNLELALMVSDNAEAELRSLTPLLKDTPIMNVLMFHVSELCTSERWLKLAREMLPKVPIYGGSNAYFTHINAEKPPVPVLDGVVYSINPQVHAFDNLSMVETCEAIASTIQTAKTFIGNKPLAVSTVTLKPRYNPYEKTKRKPLADELPPEVDVRQRSMLGAAWTLGSLKYLAESAADYVTYYETTGWRGLMEKASGSLLPEKFPSSPGEVFPLYQVFACVAEFASGEVLKSSSSHPLKIESLVLHKGERQRILIANMTPEPQALSLDVSAARYRCFDETHAIISIENIPAAVWLGELRLPPYALLCIDN